MKKSVKKLTLHRETLRSMEDRRLTQVAGADSGLAHPFQLSNCACETDNCYPASACFGTCSCSDIPCA